MNLEPPAFPVEMVFCDVLEGDEVPATLEKIQRRVSVQVGARRNRDARACDERPDGRQDKGYDPPLASSRACRNFACFSRSSRTRSIWFWRWRMFRFKLASSFKATACCA